MSLSVRSLPGSVVLATALLLLSAAPLAADDGPRAPDFRLETPSGETVSLAVALEKGPVILDFWATWCGPCRKALPHLQQLQDRYAESGLTVLAVSTDEPRNRPKIESTARSLGLTLSVLVDDRGQVARLYKVDAVPTSFLIARDGRVVAHHRGYRDGDEALLEQELLNLLDGEAEAAQ